MFITAKIDFIFTSLTAVQIYDFHIFTTVYSPLHGFIWNQHSDQLPVGLLAQLVEHCTGIAEVMGSNPVQAWIFFRPSFYYYLSSVHYCEDRFHIQEMLLFAHLEKQLHCKDRLKNQTDTKICDCKATKHDLWRRTKRRNRTKSSHTRNKEANKSVLKSQCNKSV